MKSRRIILVAGLLAIGLIAARVFLRHADEPQYEGKTLTQWMIVRYQPASEQGADREQKAREAVRAMGTNAIPTLLLMLRQTNSGLMRAQISLHKKTGLMRAPVTAEMENGFAAEGFAALGRDASNALPALIEICHRNVSEYSQLLALESIASAGSPPEVLAFMNEAMTNRDNGLAISALLHLTPTNTPQTSVPRLVQEITNSASRFPKLALELLTKFGTNARPAVPALVPLAAAPGKVNGSAKRLLFELDPETAAKVLTNEPYTFEHFNGQKSSARQPFG